MSPPSSRPRNHTALAQIHHIAGLVIVVVSHDLTQGDARLCGELLKLDPTLLSSLSCLDLSDTIVFDCGLLIYQVPFLVYRTRREHSRKNP